MDPGLNQLLKWGIENSDNTGRAMPEDKQATPSSGVGPPSAEALTALFGGPTGAEVMKTAMSTVTSSDSSLAEKILALDDFKWAIESIDNANNIAALDLWRPLVQQLGHEHADMRSMAASCIGTAVQNNIAAQRHAQSQHVVPLLLELALHEGNGDVRKKAMFALSSMVRNYQPGLDALMSELPEGTMEARDGPGFDAGDMETVDKILAILREIAQEEAPEEAASSSS